MIQAVRVLPSNAPPLSSPDGGQASRVLQEHSGTRPHNDYSYLDDGERKNSSSLSAENSYSTYQPQTRIRQIYRQTPSQRQQYCYDHPRHGFEHPDDQVRREKQARYLFHRFRSSDQYVNYRNRQHKKDKAGQEQKWSEELELAFFQALVRWPPMGRRKLPHKDKQKGRNQLISAHIEELTGIYRGRKQVSSHIQVLKPFVEHDPQIMRWLSKQDFTSSQLARMLGSHAASYPDTRRSSTYSFPAAPHRVHSAMPIESQMELDDLSKVKDSLQLFQPTDFQMFVQRKYDGGEVERLHTYTASVPHPLQPNLKLHDCQSTTEQQLHNCQSLSIDFPLLAAMHKRRPLHCNILVAEASITFPTLNFKDRDGSALPGVELGISFLCTSHHLPANAQVHCQNTFYKDSRPLREYSGVNAVALTPSEDGSTVEAQLKFGSTFWAKNLAFLANQLRDDTDLGRGAREEVSSHIHGITASQEIAVMTRSGYERLLVVYWKFRLSSTSQGRTYWTRLLLPIEKTDRVDSVYENGLGFARDTASQQVHPPQPSALQSPFEYDSSSSSAVTSATWPNSLDNNTRTAPQTAIDYDDSTAFAFHGDNLDISYDPNLDFSTFNSSAFNFDAMADFGADAALHAYSEQTQDYSQQLQDYPRPADSLTQWDDSYTRAFDGQPMVTDETGYATWATEAPSRGFDGYTGHYDHAYTVGPDGQAYGGAGQHVSKDDDALAALVDASYMARSMSHQEN